MKLFLPPFSSFLPLLVVGCASSGTGVGDVPVEHGAHTMLLDAAGRPHGTADLVQRGDDVELEVHARDLPAGPKGIHLHAVGLCTAPDFKSAGGHWNPTGHQHGTSNPAGPHAGDLPNLVVRLDGSGELRQTIRGARLFDGPNPLLDADGAALVVHAGMDDYSTDPAGNSGARFACGVVERR